MTPIYDKIIFGAGLYGLYSALFCARRGDQVCVLERDSEPFSRATYVNQARVHMGYHYPRSISTALKSAHYFERFVEDFDFCIKQDFKQIYATSSKLGWTTAEEFVAFCKAANIPCMELPKSKYFKNDSCDGAFLTQEYTYDAKVLRDYFLKELSLLSNVELRCSVRPVSINKTGGHWRILCSDSREIAAPFCLNATYASINGIHRLINADPFPIKYELCEIILCETSEELKNIGITVMDGPFFSIMPFGQTGLHSLTSVTFTPHNSCKNNLPDFPCQKETEHDETPCVPGSLQNCDACAHSPRSAWPLMSALARKYMHDDFEFSYKKSLYSMKPIMLASEVDDSRPTVIEIIDDDPKFVSVLSGKINTVYDLDEFLL